MNDRPWMTALEMQYAALGAVRRSEDSNRPDMLQTAMFLCSADTYAFRENILEAVARASETIPDYSVLSQELLPCSIGFWAFDDIKGAGGFGGFCGLLFGRHPDPDDRSVLFRLFGGTAQKPFPTVSWTWTLDASLSKFVNDFPRSLPEEWDNEQKEALEASICLACRFFLAGCVWLQQRIITTTGGHVERHRRKQLAREHNAPLPSDVKIIQLRRAESVPHESSWQNESVEWSCRWIVNGHWRNQPYKDERKLIYILPYVKGPDDKPLKVPSHTVYSVNR